MPRLYALSVKPSATSPFVPPPDGEIWYLRHAALADGGALGQYATLYFKTSDDSVFSLGTLRPERTDFMTLDMPLTEYVEFSVKGNAEVHLTGYLVDSDEAEVDLAADDEEEAEMEALEAALMNGGRKKTVMDLEDESEESSEEEPDLVPEIEEVTPPKVMMRAKPPSGSPAKRSPEQVTVEGRSRAVEMESEEPLSKKAAKKLKRKQRKEAKSSATEESEEQVKSQRINPVVSDSSSSEKKSRSTGSASKIGEPKKKKIRRFSNGFVIENLSSGDEEGPTVTDGKKVTIKYVGKLENGKVFDQTQGDKFFTFTYGNGEVVKGIDKGLEDMHVGDKRRLTVPAKMGYGTQGVPPTVPPDAQLSFDIEVKGIE